MEGATLGGQVIARVLADASWLPAGGLGFFTPYGPRTGAMWREFGDFARATAAVTGDEPVIDGALAWFDVIQAWLRPPADT
jgi:heme oxygenase